METVAKWFVAAVGTVGTYLWGGWDAVLVALVAFVIFDYLTGIGAAWSRKDLSSEIGTKGVAKKVGIFVVVAIANIADQITGIGDPVLRTTAVWFYIGTEAISICENLDDMGVPIPQKLVEALGRLKGKEVTDPHADR